MLCYVWNRSEISIYFKVILKRIPVSNNKPLHVELNKGQSGSINTIMVQLNAKSEIVSLYVFKIFYNETGLKNIYIWTEMLCRQLQIMDIISSI